MGSGKISRYVPGQSQEPDPDQTGRRKNCRSRETEEAGSRRRLDVGPQAESGRDGREEEASGNGAARSCGKEISRARIEKQLALSLRANFTGPTRQRSSLRVITTSRLSRRISSLSNFLNNKVLCLSIKG